MRRFGLASAAAAFVLASPLFAAAAAAPPKFEKSQLDQGMKEAPAVVQAAGLACNITAAGFIGDSDAKDAKGKTAKSKVYEVACGSDLGYVLIASAGEAPKAYDCVTLIGNPSLQCRLPSNADPKKGLVPLAAAAGRPCPITGVRAIGASASGETYYELACGGSGGFVLKTVKGASPSAIDCQPSGNLACTLTSPEVLAAAANARLRPLVAAAGKTCAITKSRLVGEDAASHVAFTEIACADGSGFMVSTNAQGQFQRAIDCAKAQPIGGGCTLSDATVAETKEAESYTHLAQKAGFPCQVSKYRLLGNDTTSNSEVVELACANRPDGRVGVFPTATAGPAKLYDCVAAGALGQSCKLSDPAVNYGRYTAELAARGKKSCKVSNARWAGHYAQSNTDLIETACSDGLPGWVMEVKTSGQIASLMSCGEAKANGAACALPGNARPR